MVIDGDGVDRHLPELAPPGPDSRIHLWGPV